MKGNSLELALVLPRRFNTIRLRLSLLLKIVAKATVQKVGSVEDAASSELMAQVLSYSEQMGSSALSANMILLSLVKTL